MNIKIIGCLLLSVDLLGGPAAWAQHPAKIPRVGYLSVLSPSSDVPRIDAFRQGLREFGYIEGQSVAIESRYAEGKLDRLPDLAGELVRLNVNVIVAADLPQFERRKMPPS